MADGYCASKQLTERREQRGCVEDGALHFGRQLSIGQAEQKPKPMPGQREHFIVFDIIQVLYKMTMKNKGHKQASVIMSHQASSGTVQDPGTGAKEARSLPLVVQTVGWMTESEKLIRTRVTWTLWMRARWRLLICGE